MSKLRTVWECHWREEEYLGFVRWALGNEQQRRRYRETTGDTFEPSAGNEAMNEWHRMGAGGSWCMPKPINWRPAYRFLTAERRAVLMRAEKRGS
jgi:hypothetical protein